MKHLVLVAGLAICFAFPLSAAAKISDHGTTCTNFGTYVDCAGKLSGLGSSTTFVNVSIPAGCTNQGDNNPPGQATGSSGPITPQNGQITFDVRVNAGHCPDHMIWFWGSTATITVQQNGVTVFTETVPIN